MEQQILEHLKCIIWTIKIDQEFTDNPQHPAFDSADAVMAWINEKEIADRREAGRLFREYQKMTDDELAQLTLA